MKILIFIYCMTLPITGYAKNSDDYIQEGMKFSEQGKTKKAIDSFIKASQVTPNNPDIHYSIGVLKGCPQALPHYEHTLKLNTKYYPALYNSGICYESLKKYDLAIKYYAGALNIKPNNDSLQYNVGNLLHMTGKYKESLPFYKKALKLNSTHYWATLNLGNSYESLEQFKDAIEYFRKAIKIDPNNSAAYISLAGPLMTLKQNKNAKESLESGARLAMKNNNARIINAVFTYLKQHYPESPVISELRSYSSK